MTTVEEMQALYNRKEDLDPELKRWIETGGPLGWTVLKHPVVFAVPYLEQMNAVYTGSSGSYSAG